MVWAAWLSKILEIRLIQPLFSLQYLDLVFVGNYFEIEYI